MKHNITNALELTTLSGETTTSNSTEAMQFRQVRNHFAPVISAEFLPIGGVSLIAKAVFGEFYRFGPGYNFGSTDGAFSLDLAGASP